MSDLRLYPIWLLRGKEAVGIMKFADRRKKRCFMAETTVKCSNCGAEIKKSDTKCPFCGYINEEGAEKKYMNRLYDIRDNLDTVDEEAAAAYGKGYGKILKIVVITLVVLLVLTGIGYMISEAKKSRNRGSDVKKSNDMLEEMAWRKEAYSEFDSLYEKGDYEKMCEAVFSSYKDDHSPYEWDHYWFAEVYNNYLLTKQDLERIDKDGWREYEAGSIFYRCSFCYYDEVYKDGKYNRKLTDEEVEKLQPVIKYMHDVLHDRLGFSDEDMSELKDTLVGEYSDLDYEKCAKVARERMGQFK